MDSNRAQKNRAVAKSTRLTPFLFRLVALTTAFPTIGICAGQPELRINSAPLKAIVLLSGEWIKATSVPILKQVKSRPSLGWQQLKHWTIAERQLSQGAIDKYRDMFSWTHHHNVVITIAILLLVLIVVTGALLVKHLRLRYIKTKLEQSESRYRHLIESQMSLICRHLPDTTLTFANEAFCRFFDKPRDELMGTKLIELLAEPARKTAMNKVSYVLEQCQRCDYDFRMELTNGNSGWHHWEMYPITDNDGKIVEIQAIAHDISDRKRAEEANLNLTHAMRLAVAGELTAMVAHEVSQPLGAIMANADAAQIMLKSPNPPIEELRQILTDIRASDQRADQAVRRIRNLLRKREMNMRPLDLNKIVARTLQLVSGDALHRNIQINSELELGLPQVLGDHIYVQQVLLNLIINGMDAMNDIPSAMRNLTVQTRAFNPTQIGVAVSDNGKGIAPEHVQDIFGSFYTTKKDGMGLGLTICRSIIESHQGEIWVENKPGNGATFQFSLKVA